MRWITFVTTSLSMIVLVYMTACSRYKTVGPYEEDPKLKKSISQGDRSQNGPADGTVDGGGGGNKICGRPIDAFRKNITELPEFKKYIDPLFQYFLSPSYEGCNNCQIHNFAIGAHIAQALFKKGWYFVPCSLEQISKEKIGSIFDTEQVAIQTFDDIWLDQEKYNSLSEEDRALMLFHEIIMSVKILKFDSSLKQCEVIVPDVGSCNDIRITERKKLSLLTTSDYKEVRIVTNELFHNYKKYDLSITEPSGSDNNSEGLYSNELMRKHNFSNGFHIWKRRDSDTPVFTSTQLIGALNRSKLSQDMPQFTDHKITDKGALIAAHKCNLDFNYNEPEKKLTLIFKTTSLDNKLIEQELKKEFPIDLNLKLNGHYIDSLRNGQLESVKEFTLPAEWADRVDNSLKMGERSIRVFLQFDSSDKLHNWELMETVCTSEVDGKCSGTISVTDSKVSRICSKDEKVSFDDK